MSELIELSPASVEAVARRFVEIFSGSALPVRAPAPIASIDEWLDRPQAAAFLNLPLRTFDRKRKLHPEALKPCDEHPLRWSRNALDVFKLTRGAPLHGRAGRRPKHPSTAAAA